MLLDARTHYLVLRDQPDRHSRGICVASTLVDAVSEWTSGSRLSPIWLIRGFDGRPEAFHGAQSLLFIGPVHPAELFTGIQGLAGAADAGVWLTAGCFNLVLRIPDNAAGNVLKDAVLGWVEARHLAHEVWGLQDGVINSRLHKTCSGGDARPIIDKLAVEAVRDASAVLRSSFQENIIVTATSLTRAAAIYPSLFVKLQAVAEAACATIQAYHAKAIGVLEMQSRLLSMNAALSRFSSQAFSGVPPIEATECHFWVHSLLGTGSANIALSNLVDAIQQVLGEARLPQRLAALKGKTERVPNKNELSFDTSPLSFDIMAMTKDDAVGAGPIIPLVTYFSGRDGFSSQLQTLSAPLTTLAECSSLRSNLLTVTHELSHIFIQAVLSELSPSQNNEEEMAIARRVAQPHFQAGDHLEAARQLLVEAVITMESARFKLNDDEVDRKLPELFERWRSDLQEILVHTFDFLYFHQGDPAFYVKSIWHSWCSIPGISDRVPEYLTRTLCAVAATLLDLKTDNLFDAAVVNATAFLKEIHPNIDPASNYVEQALVLLTRLNTEPGLRRAMEKDFTARLYLVRLVRIYLYSDLLAAQLFADPFLRSTRADTKKRLSYDLTPLGNALTFLKDQLKENPSEAESLWVLHCLAFDLRPRPEVAT